DAPQNQCNDTRYKGFPMKWHKFLTYFLIWAGAVLNLVNGVQVIKGDHYGGVADRVYSLFSAMRATDIIFGVVVLLIAALQFFTAIKLLGLRRGAPKLLIISYVSSLIASAAYVGAAMIIVNKPGIADELLSPAVIASLAISIIMICANAVYYKKRESLFVN
ncbi:MAG: hypothetical protein IKZ81_01160, partial [Clostridia bacterium]|nr:hypothetical protein [Clostridia bacterium]